MIVALISANQVTVPYPVYPLGVDLVAAALAERHEVHVVDLLGSSTEEVERSIVELSPDLVGIAIRNIDNTDASSAESFVDGYRQLVRAVRRATPAPLVLGGAGFTIFPAALMRELQADYGIVGEGESLALLLEALERGQDPLAVPGVVTPAAPARPSRPLSALRARTSRLHLDPAVYLRSGGILNLQTKRGCPFRCAYCTYPQIEGRQLRARPPREVALEARTLQEAGARFLFVTDGTFNADPDHNLQVALAFRQQGVSIPWGAFFAPTAPAAGYFEALAGAGLTHVEFGTESLSERGLAALGKPFRVDDVRQAHAAARAARLNVAHYFLLGGPGEERSTLDETLTKAQELRDCILFFFCGVRIYPGTPLFQQACREGQVSPDQDLLEPVFYRPAGLASIDLEALLREWGRGRLDWIYGAHAQKLGDLVSRMHRRGHTGPLWEKLIG
jgi:radical SAM superfamily enzyme YgiQ (UPF0313 family)